MAKTLRIKRGLPTEGGVRDAGTRTRTRAHARGKLRTIHLGEGLPTPSAILEELQDMTDILMGRTPPDVDAGHLTLMEVADAYFARASEITMLIQAGERTGSVTRGSGHYRIRTGELRTFMELAKRASDLGSRRLTMEQLQYEMEHHGRESKGWK